MDAEFTAAGAPGSADVRRSPPVAREALLELREALALGLGLLAAVAKGDVFDVLGTGAVAFAAVCTITSFKAGSLPESRTGSGWSGSQISSSRLASPMVASSFNTMS